jgi:hypothetical protein
MVALDELMNAATAKGGDGVPGIVLLGVDGTGLQPFPKPFSRPLQLTTG